MSAQTLSGTTSVLKLTELVSGLNLALNLTEALVPGHGSRCAWIGLEIADRLGLSEVQCTDLYYLLMLKDLGCSSNASRIAQFYMTDDIELKHHARLIGMTDVDTRQFLEGLVARNKAPLVRNSHLEKVLAGHDNIQREVYDKRCREGAEIVRNLQFSAAVEQGILDLNEHWDHGGQPLGLGGDQISLLGRIGLLAQVVDVFYSSFGSERAMREVELRSGTVLDPNIAEIFTKIAMSEQFWDNLADTDLEQKLFRRIPAAQVMLVDDTYLDEIASAFARVIDNKSPYTAGHSARVASLAQQIAVELGVSDCDQRALWRAGLLHDIGKLGVSSEILEKPGKLDADEYMAVRMHVTLGAALLSRIQTLQPVASIVAGHHEMLDGSGYPKGVKGDQITILTRILTVADIFDAMTEDRPYRKAMTMYQALDIMRQEFGEGLDPACFAGLCQVLENNPELSHATP